MASIVDFIASVTIPVVNAQGRGQVQVSLPEGVSFTSPATVDAGPPEGIPAPLLLEPRVTAENVLMLRYANFSNQQTQAFTGSFFFHIRMP